MAGPHKLHQPHAVPVPQRRYQPLGSRSRPSTPGQHAERLYSIDHLAALSAFEAGATTQIGHILIQVRRPLFRESPVRVSHEIRLRAPRHPAITGGLTSDSWRFATSGPRGIRPFSRGLTGSGASECRRAQDANRDIPVPLAPGARRQPLGPGSPRSGSRRRHDASPAGTVGRRHDPTTQGATACRMRSAYRLHGAGDYRPSLRSPWPAAGANLRKADALAGRPGKSRGRVSGALPAVQFRDQTESV